MHPRALLARLGSALLLTLIAASASAQSRFYVGGTAIADIRNFDSIQLDPRILASLGELSSRDGTAPGGGVRVGTFLHPHWSLELAFDAASKTTNSLLNPIERLPSRSSTLRLPELSTSSRFSTISTVVGFHPDRMGRVRLGYLGGMALVSGTYEATFPEFSYIPIDLSSIRSLSSIPGLASLTQSIPTITGGTLRQTDNSVGGVIGFEAAIDLSDHLALVPGVRAVVFSSGGQSIFLTRTEVGVRWAF